MTKIFRFSLRKEEYERGLDLPDGLVLEDIRVDDIDPAGVVITLHNVGEKLSDDEVVTWWHPMMERVLNK